MSLKLETIAAKTSKTYSTPCLFLDMIHDLILFHTLPYHTYLRHFHLEFHLSTLLPWRRQKMARQRKHPQTQACCSILNHSKFGRFLPKFVGTPKYTSQSLHVFAICWFFFNLESSIHEWFASKIFYRGNNQMVLWYLVKGNRKQRIQIYAGPWIFELEAQSYYMMSTSSASSGGNQWPPEWIHPMHILRIEDPFNPLLFTEWRCGGKIAIYLYCSFGCTPSLVNFLMSGAAKTSADDLLAKMAAS